jgi:hypothetical protein
MTFARSLAASAVALLAALPACQKSPPPAPAPQPIMTTPKSGVAVAPPPAAKLPTIDAPVTRADEIGVEFLTALKAGKANPEDLTPAFKRVVAPASFTSDAARGYSDWAAADWLAEFAGAPATGAKVTWLPLPDGAVLGVAEPAAPAAAKVFTTVRVGLVPAQWGETFGIDWVQVSPPRPPADLSADTAARFAAVAFVDAVLTKSPALASALLDPAAAKRLAPPLDEADAKLGYNRGLLGFKFDGFRGNSTAATFAKFTTVGLGVTVTGELTGKSAPRAFTVVVAPAGGGWRVEEFRAD